MAERRTITRADILPMAEYGQSRADWRRKATAIKRTRRMEIGPFVTFYFESYDTMWLQVHEMLFIEKGGDEQIADELAAYNPLIPNGRELTATFMIEIDDPARRRAQLGRLGGIEDTAFLRFGDHIVAGAAEADQDRTTSAGKASSVQFVHFVFTDDQIAAFRVAGTEIVLGLTHPNYSHMAVMPDAVREALAADFA
jgi:hypothetical protein